MQLYEIEPGGGLAPRAFDTNDWPPQRPSWLDGVSADPAVLLPLVAPLRPHPLLLEDLLGPNRTTLITRYDDMVYLEFPAPATEAVRGVPYVAILFRPGLLISVPHGPVPDLGRFAAGLLERPSLAPATLEGLLIEILGHLVDASRAEALALRDLVYAASDALDEDVDDVALEEIGELRQRLRVLAIVAEDQHYCVTNLHPNAAQLWDQETEMLFLRDLVNDTEYIMRTAGRLEQRLEGLHDQYQLALHDRTEARLRVLTIISVIILPLSLITGFFGMNFEDLILTGLPYGQELVLALLLLLPLGMLWYFRRRGWFD